MKLSLLGGALIAAASFAFAAPAQAHATLAIPEVSPNSTYKAVVQIGHGCQSQPTLKVKVQIPEGVIAVTPMPKPGWTLETSKGTYARGYTVSGTTVSEGVVVITWTGSLADGVKDEFVFEARVTDAFKPGDTIYFPVVQECATAKQAWIERPEAGQDPHSLKSPAPGVRVVAENAVSAVKAGSITIEQPWIRATPAGAPVAGGFLRVTNAGDASDRLVGGSVPFAGRVEVHEMVMDGSVMRMRPVGGGLEIKSGATVELKPGGYHLMFMELKEPLKEGQSVKGTLTFEKAGTVAVPFEVRSMSGQSMHNKH